MSLPRLDAGWTLFLDRDGVLNERRVDDYVKRPSELVWAPLALPALRLLRPHFAHFIVVTNQQGVAKGLMSEYDLASVHRRLRQQAELQGVVFEAIYACTDSASLRDNCRKPAPTMGKWAKRDFPEIDFGRSIMVGDSASDIGFGESLGMLTVGIGGARIGGTFHYAYLWDFAQALRAAQEDGTED